MEMYSTWKFAIISYDERTQSLDFSNIIKQLNDLIVLAFRRLMLTYGLFVKISEVNKQYLLFAILLNRIQFCLIFLVSISLFVITL